MRALLTLIALAALQAAQAQGALTIEFALNRPAAGGVLRVALCPGAEAYDREQGCLTRSVEVNEGVAQARFEGLAPGRYAIKAYHDINGNGKLDTNWMGIPKEPYGFGNDAMGAFGPPSYEQAAVKVDGPVTVRVRMKG